MNGTGEGRETRGIWQRLLRAPSVIVRNRFALFILVALVVLGSPGLFAAVTAPEPIETMNQEEAIQYQIDSLTNDTPPANASAEDKAKHYTQLAYYNVEAGDIEGAAKALADKEKAVPEKMDYVDYYRLGLYYKELKKNDDALQALTKCEQALPAADDPKTGYSRAEMIENITKLRQEITS